MSKQRIIYGRRIGSAEFLDDVQRRNNQPLNNGLSNDLILRMIRNTPENEKGIRGMF